MPNKLLGSPAISNLGLIPNIGQNPSFSLDTGQYSCCLINQFLTIFLAQFKNWTGSGFPKTTTLKIDKSIFPNCPELAKVFDFIEANYRQPIKLGDLAKAVGYSQAHLSYLVHLKSGKTVMTWITERRLVEATSLLLETEQKIEEIALAVGYSDVGYFFRLFRKYYNATPQAWRKAQRSTR
jgi:AraC family transcriptional regulator